MLMLAIETASPNVGVALHDGTQIIASESLAIGSRHAEALLPAAHHLLAQCGFSISSVSHLAVDRGPGLYTGLRVGLATVRTLAFALDVPVVGVASLEALAFAGGRDGETVVAVLDARRREVYAGVYSVTIDDVVELVAPFVGPASAVASSLAGAGGAGAGGAGAGGVDAGLLGAGLLGAGMVGAGLPSTVLVGDGARAYLSDLGGLGPVVWSGRPTAAAVACLAATRLASGTAMFDPFELQYLRLPDAEITWSNRNGPADK
jgi:tRNA threonylcarbamoyl adenosine modification protein YeaZ